MTVLAQKLRDPPSPPANVQHCEYVDSPAQSAFVVHRRTVCVPVHVEPSDVAHALLAVHATAIGPVVHLGAVPPVTGIVPQQTSEAGQPAGEAQAPEPASEPELDPELEPELEPELDPELEPELDPEPELEPELDPEPEPDPLDPPLPPAAASASPDPGTGELDEHAPSARARTAGTSSQVMRMAPLLTRARHRAYAFRGRAGSRAS